MGFPVRLADSRPGESWRGYYLTANGSVRQLRTGNPPGPGARLGRRGRLPLRRPRRPRLGGRAIARRLYAWKCWPRSRVEDRRLTTGLRRLQRLVDDHVPALVDGDDLLHGFVTAQSDVDDVVAGIQQKVYRRGLLEDAA